MQFLWIIAEISSALSVLQSAFTNVIMSSHFAGFAGWVTPRVINTVAHGRAPLGVPQFLMGPCCAGRKVILNLFQEKPSPQIFTTVSAAHVINNNHLSGQSAWCPAPPHTSSVKWETLLNHLHVMD